MRLAKVLILTFCVGALASRGSARAQRAGGDGAEDTPPESPVADPSRAPAPAPPLSPSLFGPGRAAPLVYVGAEAGWDGARRGALFETNVEAAVAGPLSFRAGAAVSARDGRASPLFALKLDVLTQGRHGIDAAVFGAYRGQGFNLVPAVEMGMSMARRSERLSLLASVAYGQGLEQGERYGDVRLAGLVRVLPRANVNVGLDARARFDLEFDNDEPAGEAGAEGMAGPIISWGIGQFVLSGQAGVAVVSPHSGQGSTQFGAATRMGVGAAF